MGKGIATHDRFIGLYRHPRQVGNQARGFINLLGVDIGQRCFRLCRATQEWVVVVATHIHRHHKLFQSSIACALTDAVDGAFQLAKLRVDIIEAGFPFASPGDFEAVQRIADLVGTAFFAAQR